ncbi:MAG: GTP 3',8-cyclase MoaA [Planctomycetes bacterium]|nr:GTP 3',8-cyclase MoaA [Planctomycetota bacterium]
MDAALDTLNRPQHALRLSVIDRCNFRCDYCMPQETYQWLPQADILTLEEMLRLAQTFVKTGGRKIRLTGGEPLLRNNLSFLIRQLATINGLQDLALTTNAYLLAPRAQELKDAGLHRLNISLDTLQPKRFESMCNVDGLTQTIAGIDAALEAQFENTKLDMVVIKNENCDELIEMLEFSRSRNVQLRFIEYMDVGGALNWNKNKLMTAAEILKVLTKHYGAIDSVAPISQSAPASVYRLADGYEFGIIASMSKPFCGDCDRSRVTADGHWYSCLYATSGRNLRETLRHGSDAQLQRLWQGLWKDRNAQSAVQRAELTPRQPAMNLDELLADPHLEMHTRGG